MEQKQVEFMREAIRLACENVASGQGGPFAAVVVKDGKIIATGVNRVTSDLDPTAHAEVNAIRAACKVLGSFQLDGCDIYTTCEPCPMCLGAIYWARAKQVYYANTQIDAAQIGFDDRFIYEEIDLDPLDRQIPMKPLLRDEGLEIFRLWEDTDAKTEY
ncbi:MAG: nucleoside deaminase [Bacteroidota bacterium]